MAVIHCRYCGTDNVVADDVVGKLCDQCRMDIYLPEIEQAPRAPSALADRTSGVLRVTCPHCQAVSQFPDWSDVDIFICEDCGEPVAVEEPVQ
jgi:hypothetical protein